MQKEYFEFLHMLSEVALSAIHRRQQRSLPEQESGNQTAESDEVSKPQARKSSHNSEKLSLEQIKKLSERSLVEMFSEPFCDEMNRKYSFQCFIIPDQCSLVFKSFGNETRAKNKMKFHLLAHIRELTAAASGNREPFMAEPVYIRKKRLQEMNRKSCRKKKHTKQSPCKSKKNPSSEQFLKKCKAVKASRIDPEISRKGTKNSMHICPSEIGSVKEGGNNIQSEIQYFPYSCNPSHENPDQGVVERLSDVSDSSMSVSRGCVKRKQRSQNHAKKMKVLSAFKSGPGQESNSDQQGNNSKVYYDDQSEPSMCIHHDHTYTSVNGKTYDSSDGTSKDSSKVYKDPFHHKKISCHRLKEESPLIIPTPPFPYVYIPLLPHIALIQEVASDTKTVGSEYEDISDDLKEYSINEESASCSSMENNCLGKAESQATVDNVLDTEVSQDAMKNISQHKSNDEVSDNTLLLSRNDVKPDMSELQAVEKKLALKCIRALRTKKKHERGPLTCQICKNKSFTAQATLMYHYRSHAGIKPFSCSVCEATFTRQHSLNYHMLIHANKSRFVCTDCGRNFRHPSHYKEHLRRHSGEMPYECTDCNSRFKTRNTYKRHLTTVHGKILTAQGISILTTEDRLRNSPRKWSSESSLCI